MKTILLAILLAVSGCAAPARSNLIYIKIRNRTDTKIEVVLRSGFLMRVISIEPGQSWDFWIDRRWILQRATVEIWQR